MRMRGIPMMEALQLAIIAKSTSGLVPPTMKVSGEERWVLEGRVRQSFIKRPLCRCRTIKNLKLLAQVQNF